MRDDIKHNDLLVDSTSKEVQCFPTKLNCSIVTVSEKDDELFLLQGKLFFSCKKRIVIIKRERKRESERGEEE